MTAVVPGEGTAASPALPGRRSRRSRRGSPAGAPPPARRRSGRLLPYLLVVPTLVALGAGLGYPLVRLVVISTQEFGRRQQFGAPARYVGTDNYDSIFGTSYFWDVLWRSLAFCGVNVVLTLVLGTLLALLLTRLGPGMRTALSVALLLAWATPALTATIVWQWIFDARYGVVNWVLTRLGADYQGHSWLSEPLSFFFVGTLVVVWMGVPFVAFTLYAGMTQISPEVMEAAAIDGAGPWQRFRDVTWPALLPIFVVLAALSTLWDLRVFTQVYVLQQAGGIVRETNTLGVYAYRQGGSGDFGLGAAVAVVMVGITLLLTLVYLRRMFRQEEL
ncbi:MAG TPA: sugar ABC transporter permease [Acidimicrobiales bacterium]|nr:sugar ABC transporter permease [Acidimicrobiales bacterium]